MATKSVPPDVDPVLLAKKVNGADPELLGPTPIELHGVMLALSKAKALAWVLDQIGAPDGGNDLVAHLAGRHAPDNTRGWLHMVVAEGLQATLGHAEAHYEAAVLRLHRRLSGAA